MLPKPKKPTKTALLTFNKEAKNLSDLKTEISSTLITDRNLWLSYDEDARIERLIIKDEDEDQLSFENHCCYELKDFFDLPADNEMDMEALAYEEPYLWFCGSMSLKRNSPDEEDTIEKQLEALQELKLDENRFSLGCIPCLQKDGNFQLFKEADYKGEKITAKMMRGGSKSSELHNALLADEHLKDFMRIPCKDNGFDIEGLAVCDSRILIGLRGPVLNGYAVILEIWCDSLNNELIMQQRKGESKLYRKHFIDLNGKGIRELNCFPNGDLYILAGPTMDLDGTISLYKIEGGLEDNYASVVHHPERLFDVARGTEIERGEDKAEGVAFLNEKEIIITYDSPQQKRLIGDNKVAMDVFDL